jgi:hypothetical protein
MRTAEDEPKARVAFLAPSSGGEARAFLQERLGVLGRVAISTVASRSIFGLREQVREASQLGQYNLEDLTRHDGPQSPGRVVHVSALDTMSFVRRAAPEPRS